MKTLSVITLSSFHCNYDLILKLQFLFQEEPLSDDYHLGGETWSDFIQSDPSLLSAASIRSDPASAFAYAQKGPSIRQDEIRTFNLLTPRNVYAGQSHKYIMILGPP